MVGTEDEALGALLEAMFSSPTAALCLLDAELRVVRATRTWLASSGLGSDHPPRDSLRDLAPDRAAELLAAMDQPLTTRSALAPRADPTGGTWEESATAIRLGDGVGLLVEATRAVSSADAALRVAIDSVPFGMLVIEHTVAGGIHLIATNPAHRRIVGMADRLGVTVAPYELYYADRVTPIPARDWPGPRAVRTGRPIHDEIVHARRADGTWRVIEASAVVLDEVGCRRRAVVVTLDVTERWEAQQALAKSEQTYRAAFQNVEDGVVLLHPTRSADGAITGFIARTANEAAARMLGSTVEALCGKRLDEVAEVDRVRFLDPILRRVLETGQGDIEERSFGGREYLVKTCRIGEDVLQRVAIDVTDVRRAEVIAREHAQRSHAELLDLVGKLPVGVFVTNEHGIVYANPAFVSYLGRSLSTDVVGKSLAELGVEGSPEPGAEWRVEREDGATLTLECTVRRALEFEGRTAQLWVCRDLTQLRHMQAKLLQSDRLATLGTLAAGVAHEINNPLAYLTSSLDLVAENLTRDATAGSGQELREAVADARDGVRRVRAIVKDLKAFSRPEREETTTLELPALMDSAIAMAGNELRHRARIVRRYEPTPLVLGNEARLGQVFLNLLVNAAQALPAGRGPESEIIVSLGTDANGRALVEVRDHGPGMPRELLRRVFEPFFTTKEGSGTGLGLAICRDTVTAIGGEITIDSAVGAGTVVRVALPAHVPTQPASSPRPSDPAAVAVTTRTGLRVLVVDDEAPVCKSLVRLLKDHDVVTETSGRAALERIRWGERFDVFLCDMMLLDTTGAELHAEVDRIAPEQAARMVIVTGGAFTPQTAQFLEEGALEVVHKPFDAAEIRAIVQRVGARRDRRGAPAA